jgi:predicted component of viral defense system (DUF524 family)
VAIDGDVSTSGLARIVPEIATDPHKMLLKEEPWVKRHRARRPAPSRLAAAYARHGNLDDNLLPRRIADQRVLNTFDVYENRLLKLFVERVHTRCRRVQLVAAVGKNSAAAEEAVELRHRLESALREAPFLRTVTTPAYGPSQMSMVLLRRPEYRSMMAAYQRFQRHVTVWLDEAVLEAPLADVPSLYELWGTLRVAQALVLAAADSGFEVEENELVRRRSNELRLVSRGAVVRLRHPVTGVEVVFREQPTYGLRAAGLHSVTFQQIPDIAIEISRPGRPRAVHIFDPKYKVATPAGQVAEGDETEEVFPGGPKKVDIDKMHAYRDAIRRRDSSRAVVYAAILYPGETRTFADGLEAVQCRPNAAEALDDHLQARLSTWLNEPALEGSTVSSGTEKE